MDELGIKQGSFIQQTQYFIPDSRSGGMETNVFWTELIFTGFVLRTSMFGNL
jgi:hypothetical protein